MNKHAYVKIQPALEHWKVICKCSYPEKPFTYHEEIILGGYYNEILHCKECKRNYTYNIKTGEVVMRE